MKIFIRISSALLGSFLFVLLCYALGFEQAPRMGLIDFIVFYSLPSKYICKKYDQRQERKKEIESVPEKYAKILEIEFEKLISESDQTPSEPDFPAFTRKILPSCDSETEQKVSKNLYQVSKQIETAAREYRAGMVSEYDLNLRAYSAARAFITVLQNYVATPKTVLSKDKMTEAFSILVKLYIKEPKNSSILQIYKG